MGIASMLFSLAAPGTAVAERLQRSPAIRVAEAAPNARGCIPGPHEPGRTSRMVGQAVSSAWAGAYHPSVDQRPHCRSEGEDGRERGADAE